jgi:DNA-binding transcriptional ArsR family regulator
LKAFKVINDPEAFQLLADETRRRIIYLLRAKEHTVSQIADEMGLTAQAIYHHVRKMKKAGLIEVAREVRVDHFIETYYRASAELFQLSHGESKCCDGADHSRETMEGLAKIGVVSKLDPQTIDKAIGLLSKLAKRESKSKWSNKISDMEDVDFFTKQAMHEYTLLLALNDAEFDEYVNTEKELRKLLRPGSSSAAKSRRKG